MKRIIFTLLAIVIIAIACEKNEQATKQVNKEIAEAIAPNKYNISIIGTWIEKSPGLFDGISDTIIFTEDELIRKHFYFEGWSYTISSDSISFQKDEKIRKYLYSISKNNEMIIYNFLDRSITCVVKDIQFIKIK